MHSTQPLGQLSPPNGRKSISAPHFNKGYILNGKITITERGYALEIDGNIDTAAIKNTLQDLELQLSELPSRRGASGAIPKAIQASHAADDQTMLAFVATQGEARARKYLEDNCTLSVKAARASITRLIKAGELELRPATYVNASGNERPMQGVFFVSVEEETPKTSFGL